MPDPATTTSSRPPRILLLRGGAIGDFIVTLPAIEALRQRWPDSHMELVAYPRVSALAQLCGIVSAVTSIDKAEMAQLFSLRPTFTTAQREFFQSFDLIFSWLYDPGNTVHDNLHAIGVRHFAYGNPFVEDCHAVDQLAKPLASVALYLSGNAAPHLPIPTAMQNISKPQVEKIGQHVLAIHPGSGSAKKNWPLSRFLEVAEWAREKTALSPCFILGDAEQPLQMYLRESYPHIPLLTKLSLTEVACFLSCCHTYLGNDSGITHLAAAVGTSTIALFGPTNPTLWAPRGPHVQILHKSQDLLSILPDDVCRLLRPMDIEPLRT